MVVDLEYLVAYGEDGLEITLVPPPDLNIENVPAADIFHDGETLTFTIDVGTNVQCTLFREEDGAFEGECVDEAGEGGLMTMVPPAGGR
ncbi:MAG: hypothetical protein R3266_06095 [Gemmatimonadota bacterium]|nr:hypothetical protein [Gemmatimonadota bacterium]